MKELNKNETNIVSGAKCVCTDGTPQPSYIKANLEMKDIIITYNAPTKECQCVITGVNGHIFGNGHGGGLSYMNCVAYCLQTYFDVTERLRTTLKYYTM